MNDRLRTFGMALLLWFGTFFGFTTVAHGNLETVDAAITMHAARALWVRGDSGLLRADQGGELLGECMGAAYIHVQQAAGDRQLGKIGRNDRAYVWFPIGHVWLLVPFVAAGEALQAGWPGAEAAFRDKVAPGATDAELENRLSYAYGHPVLTQGLIALLLPPACAATSLLLLLLLARALGAGRRDAVIGAAAIVTATQMFALGREQLSDGPGLCCMLGVLLATVRAHTGTATRRTLLLGGIAAGCAVLLRYQNAFLVAACAAALGHALHRRGRLVDGAWFVLGGVPFLAAMLAVNHARFGSVFDTGYPEYGDWFDQPRWLGTAKFLFAAGRGILWLSPLLWLALPLAARRRNVGGMRWLAWVLFATPILLFAGARGWQGGQCWGARYVTPGIVLLLALVLPQARPWHRFPRTWLVLLACGMFVNLTSVLAPTRGVIQLASQAVQAAAAAATPPEGLSPVTIADRTSWHPLFSPLHANWSYAVHSRRGCFETPDGGPDDRSVVTIEPLFGTPAASPQQGLAPQRWEDRCGRHLWWQFWGELLGVPPWLLLLPVLAAAVACASFGCRRYVALDPPPSDSSTAR